MKQFLLASVLALALAGCAASASVGSGGVHASAAATTSNQNALQSISQFTVTDLQNADAIAVGPNPASPVDPIGHACYPALIQFIQSLPGSSPSTTVSGAFSAFETARVTVNQVQGFQVPIYLKMGCAPLLVDTQTFLANLAAIGGGAVVLH